jgi:hypothetical protein
MKKLAAFAMHFLAVSSKNFDTQPSPLNEKLHQKQRW